MAKKCKTCGKTLRWTDRFNANHHDGDCMDCTAQKRIEAKDAIKAVPNEDEEWKEDIDAQIKRFSKHLTDKKKTTEDQENQAEKLIDEPVEEAERPQPFGFDVFAYGTIIHNDMAKQGIDHADPDHSGLKEAREKLTSEEIFGQLKETNKSLAYRIDSNIKAIIMDNHWLDLKQRCYVQGASLETNIIAFMDMVIRDVVSNDQNHKFYHANGMDNCWPFSRFIHEHFDEVKERFPSQFDFRNEGNAEFGTDEHIYGYSYCNFEEYEKKLRKLLGEE